MTGEYIGIGFVFSGIYAGIYLPDGGDDQTARSTASVENVVYSMTGQQPVYVEDVSGISGRRLIILRIMSAS